MPVIQIHTVAAAHPPEAVGNLLREASTFYAVTLYPETDPPPLERVRAFVSDVAPEHWATSGVAVSDGGMPAPYFTCLALSGRPADQLKRLMSGMTDMICRHLCCERSLVRGQLIELDPAHWYIAGAPASEARAGEISARSKGTA